MSQLRNHPQILGNIWRLSAAQALAGANASVIFATGALVGARLAPHAGLSTLPISLFVVGMAAGTLPAGYLAQRFGRKVSFLTGTFCGLLAGLIGAWAVYAHSFGLFCLATFSGGLYGAVVQSFRFAATDGVQENLRPKALAWVMAGGVFAGVLGPQLVNLTMGISKPLFMVSYLAQAGIAVIAAFVLAGVKMVKPKEPETENQCDEQQRPWMTIIRQPAFILAALCGVVSYSLMNLMMTSAPLAMQMCGLPLGFSNLVIEWHIIAMYGPSFFTGPLIARFGARLIVAVGLLLIVAAAVMAMSELDRTHFMTGLVLLGLGWNFGFVGASNMVLETHTPSERNRVQAFNDFLIFGTMAVGSFSSGQILNLYGWGAVNMVVLVPAAMMLIILLMFGKLKGSVSAT